MPDSHRSSLARRRYRLAQATIVAGSLAVGSLVVERLVAFFREDFFLFYGVDDGEYAQLQRVADDHMPVLSIGQLAIAAFALFGVIAFVAAERRRMAQTCSLESACRRRSRLLVVSRLRGASLFDAFVVRTSAYGGLLLSVWLLQSSLERWLGGLGLGIEYASWRSLLPLASVFGVCVLAGMLVAAVSLVGMRAIHVLEFALDQLRTRQRRTQRYIGRPTYDFAAAVRTVRERMGCEILSRPPPLAC